MSVDSLTWSITSTGETIYDPAVLTTSSSVVFTISNLGTEDVTNLGLYIAPASDLGDVDYPADSPPDTDYQDLLTWGSSTEAGLTVSGGLKLTLPQEGGGTATSYVTRDQGATAATKLPMADLLANTSVDITAVIESPGVGARRLYINLVADDSE